MDIESMTLPPLEPVFPRQFMRLQAAKLEKSQVFLSCHFTSHALSILFSCTMCVCLISVLKPFSSRVPFFQSAPQLRNGGEEESIIGTPPSAPSNLRRRRNLSGKTQHSSYGISPDASSRHLSSVESRKFDEAISGSTTR
jgi:hypothetical protein